MNPFLFVFSPQRKVLILCF